MKYKTTIEIVADAGDKSEAMEIAGEYLSGNLISGVRMKCRTNPVYVSKVRAAASAMVIISVITLSVFFTAHTKAPQGSTQTVSGIDAIQPPLQTSIVNNSDSGFKREWQDRQTKKALDYLKQ